MAFTVAQLLLTEQRQAQLTAALANAGAAVPLEQIVTEAIAEVDRYTAGYEIAEEAKAGWVRVIALNRAYVLASLTVPRDIASAAEAAVTELRAIAAGERPNLPRTESADGAWGSATRIGLRA